MSAVDILKETQQGQHQHSVDTDWAVLYMGLHTLAPSDECNWNVRVWRRCGLMSNYSEHLLYMHTTTHIKSL